MIHYIKRSGRKGTNFRAVVARITLTYRFGKKDVKDARRRSTGAEDEAKRMNQ